MIAGSLALCLCLCRYCLTPPRSNSSLQRPSPVYPAHLMGSANSKTAAHLYSRTQIVSHGHHRRHTAVVRRAHATMFLGCRTHESSLRRFEVLSEEVASSRLHLACYPGEVSFVPFARLDYCLRGCNRGCRVYSVGMVWSRFRR